MRRTQTGPPNGAPSNNRIPRGVGLSSVYHEYRRSVKERMYSGVVILAIVPKPLRLTTHHNLPRRKLP
jgi:hypothetical protein